MGYDILVQDWYWIGGWVNVCHCIGGLVMDCHWIGGLVNWLRIAGLVMDWQIDIRLADLHGIGRLAWIGIIFLNWSRSGNGLMALDWQICRGLALDS